LDFLAANGPRYVRIAAEYLDAHATEPIALADLKNRMADRAE